MITTITVPLEPKIDCANTDPNALLLPVDYADAMAQAAFDGAVIYSVDDPGQYNSVIDMYFSGLPKPTTDLASVVSGKVEVPTTGRRMFLNMGIAMDDIALEFAGARARCRGRGGPPHRIPLIAIEHLML